MQDLIHVTDIMKIRDFELLNTDKICVIHTNGDEELFKHTNIDDVFSELMDRHVDGNLDFVKSIFAV